jgi:hypothetical protein
MILLCIGIENISPLIFSKSSIRIFPDITLSTNSLKAVPFAAASL